MQYTKNFLSKRRLNKNFKYQSKLILKKNENYIKFRLT
jgi:hypothetical protein